MTNYDAELEKSQFYNEYGFCHKFLGENDIVFYWHYLNRMKSTYSNHVIPDLEDFDKQIYTIYDNTGFPNNTYWNSEPK